jgi:hypothetical protein
MGRVDDRGLGPAELLGQPLHDRTPRAQPPVRLTPELQSLDAEDLRRFGGFTLARGARIVDAVAARLPGGKEDARHTVALEDMAPERPAAPDRLIVWMGAHDEHAAHRALQSA